MQLLSSPSAPERFTTSWGQRLGDCLIVLVLTPIGAAALTLVLLMVAWFCHAVPAEPSSPVTISTAVVMTLTLFWLTRQRFWWTLRLEDDRLRLGPRLLGTSVRYANIDLLVAGETNQAMGPSRPSRQRSVPLTIRLGPLHRYRLWLDPAAASRGLDLLRSHCRGAAAIDATVEPPREYLPLAAETVQRGSRRLGWFWLGTALAPGALLAGVLAVLLAAVLSGKANIMLGESKRWALVSLIASIPVLAGSVRRALRRALWHFSRSRQLRGAGGGSEQ